MGEIRNICVKRGFLANGVIDDVLKICPVWENMINATPRKLSKSEIKLSNDYECIKKAHDDVHINDKVKEETYDEMKFPLDMDSLGKINDDIRRSDSMPY